MRPIVRTDRRAVAPIVAEILLVAIAVVLAAVIYIMATGLLAGPASTKPLVGFANLSQAAGNATFSVADVSQVVSMSNYRFNLGANGTVSSSPANFGASGAYVSIVVAGIACRVTWSSASGGGDLRTGDVFTVTGAGKPLPRSTNFVFYLIWVSDGTTLQQMPWTT